MNYHSRHKKKKYIFVIVLLVVLVLVFVRPNMPDWISKGAHFIGNPAWSIKQSVTDGISVRSKKSLLEENRKLQDELQRVLINKISNDLLREENISLKEMLGRSIYENTILGSVLVRPGNTLYDTFIIDVGTNNNIQEGDYVIAYGDVVVGYIESVFSNTSVVKLFSSPGEQTDVLLGSDQIAAVAEGIGGGNFTISLPRGVEIHVGDTIVTPTIESQIIALVEEVIVNPTDSFQTILFKGPITLSELRFIEVQHSYEE